MRTRLYRGGVLEREGFAIEEISEHIHDPEAAVWVDLVQPDEAELSRLGDELGLHRLAVEDAAHERQRPKVDVYAEHLFLTAYDTSLNTDSGELTTKELAVFVTGNALVTVHKDPDVDIDPVLERWDESADLARHGVSFLLWGLLDVIVDANFATVELLDEQIEGLEDMVFDPSRGQPEVQRRSFQLRKSLVRLRRVILPMREVVNALMRHDLPIQTEGMTPYWLDVYDHVLRATESTDSMREFVATILETTLTLQGNRLNSITKQVTGWAAIIAVPTAITGFYGQNLPFPGYGGVGGLWTSLVLIAAISVTLYVLFRRRDWI